MDNCLLFFIMDSGNPWTLSVTRSIWKSFGNQGKPPGKRDYEQAEEYLDKSLAIQKEIGHGGEMPLWTNTHLYLTYKHFGKDYDVNEIHTLIKETENIEFDINLGLHELLEDTSYLETAYKSKT